MNAAIAEIIEQPDGTRIALCKQCGYSATGRRPQPAHLCPAAVRGRLCGPGCQLRRSLSWFVRDDGTCGCTEYAAQMDDWGCDECWNRLEEIVEHLRQAAEKKGLPFIATAARIMVGRAIEAARAAATPPPG
jgi:hypothetical protein